MTFPVRVMVLPPKIDPSLFGPATLGCRCGISEFELPKLDCSYGRYEAPAGLLGDDNLVSFPRLAEASNRPFDSEVAIGNTVSSENKGF